MAGTKNLFIKGGFLAFLFFFFAFATAGAEVKNSTAKPPGGSLGGSNISSSIKIQKTGCYFQDYLDQLEALKKNDAIEYADSLKLELQIRQDLLKKIIECGIADAKDIQAKLKQLKLDENDNELLSIRDKYISDLNKAINYYQIQVGTINELSITGSKNLARKLLDWKSDNYNYTAGKANNLIAWVKNQELFSAAEKRYEQIQRVVSFFNLFGNKNIMDAYRAAGAAIGEAKNFNEEAWKTFSDFTPPDGSVGLVKSSLSSLSVFYQEAFNFNDVFKKILPQI